MWCRSKEIGLGRTYGLALSTSLLILYLKGTTSWVSKIKTAEGGRYTVYRTGSKVRSLRNNLWDKIFRRKKHQSGAPKHKDTSRTILRTTVRARKIFSIVTVLYSTQKCSGSQTPPISSSFCHHVMMVNGTLPSCRVYGAVFQGSTIVILYE